MAKTIEVDLQVTSNVQGSIAELKALKRELKSAAVGSEDFKRIFNQIDDLEDKIKSAKNTSSDWVDSLEQAGGPLGALGGAINRAKVSTQSFGGALKATGIGLIVALVAGLAAAFNDNEKAQKKLQPLLEAFKKILGGVFAVVEPLFDVFIDLATKALPYVSDAFKVVYSSVTAVFQSLGKLGSAVKKLISGDFSGAFEDAKSSVTGFSKNFNDAKDRFEKGSNEMTATEKENAAKRAEALEKENERKKVAADKAAQEARERREKELLEEREFRLRKQSELEEDEAAIFAMRLTLGDAQNLSLKEQQIANLSDISNIDEEHGINTNFIEKKYSDLSVKTAQEEAEAKRQINNAILESAQGLFGLLASLGEKNKGLQKAALLANSALSIAQIIANTNVGSSKEVATKGIFGLSTSAVLYAKMGISIASVLAATAKGLKGLGGGGAVGGGASNQGSGGSAPAPISAAPTFNVVGTSGQNQIAQSLGNQAPLKAYVVANDVSSQQSLDRNIVKTATLGN